MTWLRFKMVPGMDNDSMMSYVRERPLQVSLPNLPDFIGVKLE